jgi:phosphate/sulfate permease
VKRLACNLVPVGVVLLLPLPALAFWRAGVLHVHIQRGGGLIGTGLVRDQTSIYVWTVLALVYLVWIVALLVGAVWALDRLDYHYVAYERKARLSRRERRRLRGGMAFLSVQEQERHAALRDIAHQSRRATRERDEQRRAARVDEQRRADDQRRRRPSAGKEGR